MVNRSKHRAFVALLALATASSVAAQSEESCADALVASTYNRFDTQAVDYRLAWHVSERAYEEVKKKAGGNASIFGISLGGNYAEFQKSLREKTSNYSSSLTQTQATNVQWTGLDANGASAYTECIRSKKFSKRGLHLAVKAATKDEVTVWVNWSPIGKKATARPEWFWDASGSARLPRVLDAGERTIVLPRPQRQQTLSVNFQGNTDSLIVEPFPPPVDIKPVEFVQELKEHEGAVVVGWGKNFSAPYTLCTPEMPSGWTIDSLRFRLESDTERSSCGSYTTCGGQETDSSTRACRTITVQGHEGGRHQGYGRAKPVLSVVWRHPK